MNKRAIQPLERPFDVRFTLPGSKSYANRALVCAALAGRPCTISNISLGDDTALMLNVLVDLGWGVSRATPLSRDVRLKPPGARHQPSGRIFAGEAGTVARFAAALLAATPGRFELDAGPRMRERPMAPLLDALRQLGARIHERGKPGCLPVMIEGGTLRGGVCEIAGDVSSQFVSALLLVAPALSQPAEISVSGKLASVSYVAMTREVMRAFGASVETGSRFRVRPAAYRCDAYNCPPDATAAGYFWASAALTGGTCVIDGLASAGAQGDVRVAALLREMGCEMLELPNGLGIRGRPLKPLVADLSDMPDSAQTLAVACAFARGASELRGLSTLRVKETDRLQALVQELGKFGVKVSVVGDALRIEGPARRPTAPIATHGDHRMAMSFSVAGLALPGVVIEDPEVVSKSFPEFWDFFAKLLPATSASA